MTAISTIKNLGPAMETALIDAGIPDAETLRDLGADAAYAKLLENGQRPHFIGYYVLHMALQGRPWNDCKGAEKDALRATFDSLCAKYVDQARTELEAFMNRIGVRK
ncbi:TfoX/Sxy family protein [Loktanella sp. R86503]|uniref:TfoX/Sxy family protein n=1 Tax=Loktanella sp. R86503 TaxID=3093847 RepID=UPI0036DE96FF